MTQDADVLDPETPMPTDPIELRRPDIPISLSELASHKGDAIEIIEARVQVLETLRRAAIRATSPEDWLLFKSPEEHGGQIVGYLQDCGADRVRDLYGIEIYNVSKPELVETNDPAIFHYLITGSGRCKLTRQILEDVEGGRSSTDDFCKGKTGLELKLAVRKAARANLDGGITRELAGLKSVPTAELEAAWAGTSKKVEQCRHGRGFGTRDERVGGASDKTPDVEPPVCPHCESKGVYRPAKGDRAAFFGCPKYTTHPQQKFIVPAVQWEREQRAKAGTRPAQSEQPAPAAAATSQKVTPPTADEVFGNKSRGREPGQEG
jgi:hypothetical protein